MPYLSNPQTVKKKRETYTIEEVKDNSHPINIMQVPQQNYMSQGAMDESEQVEPDHSSCTSLCLLILVLLSAAMVAACLPSGAFGCLWCADYWHPVREHRLTSQSEITSCCLADLRPKTNPSAIVSCVLSQTAGPFFLREWCTNTH